MHLVTRPLADMNTGKITNIVEVEAEVSADFPLNQLLFGSARAGRRAAYRSQPWFPNRQPSFPKTYVAPSLSDDVLANALRCKLVLCK